MSITWWPGWYRMYEWFMIDSWGAIYRVKPPVIQLFYYFVMVTVEDLCYPGLLWQKDR